MSETFKSRWIVCDDCECSTTIERDDARGVPDENQWEEFGRCLVCGSSQLHWNADEDTVADRGRKAAAPLLATRDALAAGLYRAMDWSGCAGSDWDRLPEHARNLWREHADALLTSSEVEEA